MSRSLKSGAAAMAVTLLLVSIVFADAEFTPIAGWDHQLFPSYPIATAAIRAPAEQNDDADDEAEETDDDGDGESVERLGDPQGVLGVQIESPGDDVPVTVTISGNEIMEESTFSGTLETEGDTYVIYPRIKFKYGALAKNKQSVPVTVTFEVEVGDEEAEEQTETITLRSVNDCPFTIRHPDGSFSNVSFVFAAYVNEQHPFVDKVLREALNNNIVNSFTGYQRGDAAEVYRQVYAVWNALSDRDVRYSNITTEAAVNDVVSSQHVRLIDESINNAQANCVDGSVLLASVLRKIDIEPMLVFVPGHCYLAFYLDPKGQHLVGLETTLIGSVAGDVTPEITGVKNVVDEEWSQTNSWGTFCAAVAMGSQGLVKNKARFNNPGGAHYQLIPIAAARRQGILPIAFDSTDKFESVNTGDE